MSDIICTRAWHDDDYDGPEGWRIEHLWINEDGTYSTCDSDGNHESFQDGWDDEGTTVEGAVESYCKDADQSWIEYAQDCAQTGEDPLDNYYVERTVKRKENWVIWFTDWIGREQHGYAVTAARQGKSSTIVPRQFSKELSDYLCLTKVGDRYCMTGVTMEDIEKEVGYVQEATGSDNVHTGQYRITLKLTYDKPRNARDVSREIKAKAQKHLESAKLFKTPLDSNQERV